VWLHHFHPHCVLATYFLKVFLNVVLPPPQSSKQSCLRGFATKFLYACHVNPIFSMCPDHCRLLDCTFLSIPLPVQPIQFLFIVYSNYSLALYFSIKNLLSILFLDTCNMWLSLKLRNASSCMIFMTYHIWNQSVDFVRYSMFREKIKTWCFRDRDQSLS
jgi:hypothetical protein